MEDYPEQSGFEGLFITTDGTNLSFADPLPDQNGQENKFLTNNGASASWGTVDLTPYATSASPTFTGESTFNGSVILNDIIDFTSASVVGLDLLPDQNDQEGKFLTTDGTSTSWSVVDLTPYAELSGATFTGTVTGVSPTSASSTGFRRVTMSTSSPTGGLDGDLSVQHS